jgi:hypothetical protein
VFTRLMGASASDGVCAYVIRHEGNENRKRLDGVREFVIGGKREQQARCFDEPWWSA